MNTIYPNKVVSTKRNIVLYIITQLLAARHSRSQVTQLFTNENNNYSPSCVGEQLSNL